MSDRDKPFDDPLLACPPTPGFFIWQWFISASASMASLMDSHSSRPEALRSLGAAPPVGRKQQGQIQNRNESVLVPISEGQHRQIPKNRTEYWVTYRQKKRLSWSKTSNLRNFLEFFYFFSRQQIFEVLSCLEHL